MKAFIQDLAQKEAVAKQKLSDMMEQLLRRAETAEEELEVCRSFVPARSAQASLGVFSNVCSCVESGEVRFCPIERRDCAHCYRSLSKRSFGRVDQKDYFRLSSP